MHQGSIIYILNTSTKYMGCPCLKEFNEQYDTISDGFPTVPHALFIFLFSHAVKSFRVGI